MKAKFKGEKNWMTPKMNKEVFMKHGKAPNAPTIKRCTDYLVYDHVLKFTTFGHFDEFGQFSVAESGLNHTSSHQYLSFEPLSKILGPSVKKF